ncbi:MAG: fused MFS/spermidine synthase [Bdellovibrionaceae bacterium]|nr:fused MFS/spermidine synthase [Bdellovibrionales bacterium]MCB9084052.1 fused MFS/spermidine synthase [Pseudobdellovibrionaceae bacterium]
MFFLSGATSLVLEIAWSKELSYILGNSLYSSATVVAAFMCGLALGSWILPKLTWGLRHPMKTYALLQLGIGVLGFVSIPLFRSTTPLFAGLYGLGVEHPQLFLILRFAVTFVMMILPVLLMGMTLPAVVGSLAQQQGDSSAVAGRLYGINTIGALTGTFLAGFVLIPGLGLLRTCLMIGVIDFALGLWLLKFGGGMISASHEQANKTAVIGVSSRATRLFELLFFVSGGLSIVLELAWFRLLANVLGATVHAFTNMLVLFLLGVGLGSVVGASLLKQSKNWRVEIFFLQAMIGLCALVTITFYNELPYWYGHLYWLLSGGESGAGYIVAQLVISGLVIFPSTFFMGAFFPYALHLYQELRSQESLPVATGRIYAFNTVGGVIGSLAAGFLVIPALGISGTIAISALCGWLVALGFLLLLIPGIGKVEKLNYLVIVSVLTLGGLLVVPPHDPLLTSQGLYLSMTTEGVLSAVEEQREQNPSQLLYYQEGIHGSVAVVANEFGTGKVGLRVSGKPVAGAGHSDRKHLVMLGQIPLLLHPNPKRVAVVGLGTGITAGHVLSHESVEKVDILELERGVVEGSRFFNHINGQPLQDPRTRVVLEDGRIFLKYTDQTYDVITSDPISPLVSGGGNLYSREYYQEAAGKLNDHGVFCQWIQNEGLSENSYRMALKAMDEAFEYVYLFAYGFDSVVVGSRQPIQVDWQKLVQTYQSPKVQELLVPEGLTSIYEFLTYFYGGKEQVQTFLSSEDVANTDDNVKLEHHIPFEFYKREHNGASEKLLVQTASGRLKALKELIPGIDLKVFVEQSLRHPPLQFTSAHNHLFASLKEEIQELNLGLDSATLLEWHMARKTKEDVARQYQNLLNSVKTALKEKDQETLRPLLEEALTYRYGSGYYTAGIMLGEILLKQARLEETIQVAQKIRMDHPAFIEAYQLEIQARLKGNDKEKARQALALGLTYLPNDPRLMELSKSL